MDDLVEKMHHYLDEHQMKRYELARKIGSTEANITRWLNRDRKISKAWQELIKQRLELE